uniref:NAC domain-containing protein n=1 Tax=Kalanchoe fedtschenkoi TaxID=63787 RepID=A0A7N0UQX3_KALFE
MRKQRRSSSSIEVVEEKLPPGFRFYPTDGELICDYLMNKISKTSTSSSSSIRCRDSNNTDSSSSAALHVPQLIEVDLNTSEPWEIPGRACVGGKECYFYSQRDRKYATGMRTNRATKTGYWKATGKDKAVYCSSSSRSPSPSPSPSPSLVGMRKTLVFYRGRAPRGRKTEWVMHEFRLLKPPSLLSSSIKEPEDWVLCRVFHKHISGSRCITQPASSPLPQLTHDPYLPLPQPQTDSSTIISMNQDRHHSNGDHQQVPCFSILSSHSQTMSYSYAAILSNAPSFPIKPSNVEVVFDHHITMTATTDDSASNKLKSKEDSLNNFDGGNGNSSSGIYLSESMWKHHQQY